MPIYKNSNETFWGIFKHCVVVMSDDHMCKVVKREGTINYLFRCWEQTKILNSIFGIENLSCKGSKNSLTEEFYQKGFLLKHAILKSTLTPITQKLHRKALAVVFWNRQSRNCSWISVPNLSLWWLKGLSQHQINLENYFGKIWLISDNLQDKFLENPCFLGNYSRRSDD